MAQVGRRPRRTVEEQELLDVLARLEGRELTGSIVNRMSVSDEGQVFTLARRQCNFDKPPCERLSC
jgi:hypothetical protein